MIKSMKSTVKKKCQTVVSSYTFVLLPEAPMVVAGVSVWGCERPCNFSGSTAYLSDLACVAKLVLNQSILVCYFSCNTDV